MITPQQRQSIEEKLANHDDQSPEFQAWAREELEANARKYNIDCGNVGYQSPPKQYQFKKGHKGGPGRPKGSTLYVEIIEQLMGQNKAALKEIVRNLIERAKKGEVRAIKTLFYIESRKRKL